MFIVTQYHYQDKCWNNKNKKEKNYGKCSKL